MTDALNLETNPACLLIVDDMPKNIQVLAGILAKEGYQIAAAMSGVQALDLVKRVPLELILMDVNMPEMDGFEVCQRIKADRDTQGIPVIFITARTDTDDITKGFEAGAVDYVSKPFHAKELLVRVRTHVALGRAIAGLNRALENERSTRMEFEETLGKVKQLSGLVPICAQCKKIRDDQGYWTQVEQYIHDHSEAEFSHGICPECMEMLYPELMEARRKASGGLS